MERFFLIEMLAALFMLTVSDCSLLYAEIYQWTDADGSVHFSDNPVKLPEGRQPLVRRDETVSVPTSLPTRAQTKMEPQKHFQDMPSKDGTAESIAKVDPATEAQLQQIWKTLKDAILRGDIETALNQFVPGAQDRYRKMMNDPSREIVARFKEIKRLKVYTVDEKTAQAGAIRMEVDGEYSYPVSFVKNFGEWKIYGF